MFVVRLLVLLVIVIAVTSLKRHYKGRIPNPKLCFPSDCTVDSECKNLACPSNYLSSPQCVIYSFPAKSCCQCFVQSVVSPNDEKRLSTANERHTTEADEFVDENL